MGLELLVEAGLVVGKEVLHMAKLLLDYPIRQLLGLGLPRSAGCSKDSGSCTFGNLFLASVVCLTFNKAALEADTFAPQEN